MSFLELALGLNKEIDRGGASRQLGRAALLFIAASSYAVEMDNAPEFGVSHVASGWAPKDVDVSVSVNSYGLVKGYQIQIAQLIGAIGSIQEARQIAESEGNHVLSKLLTNILVRANILVVERIWIDGVQDRTLNLQHWLAEGQSSPRSEQFFDIPSLPIDYFANAEAIRCIRINAIPEGTEGSKKLVEEGFKYWEKGDELARVARKATCFGELMYTTLKACVQYTFSSYLFHWAAGRYIRNKQEVPDEIAREHVVVDEYRVGCKEILWSFGNSLIYRPRIFMLDKNECESLLERVKKGLDAARTEISVYPEVMLGAWSESCNFYGEGARFNTDQDWRIFSKTFEYKVTSNFKKVFDDRWLTKCAVELKEKWDTNEFLRLQPNWKQLVFEKCSELEIEDTGKGCDYSKPMERIEKNAHRIAWKQECFLVTSLHLLAGILEEEKCYALDVLKSCGISIEKLTDDINKELIRLSEYTRDFFVNHDRDILPTTVNFQLVKDVARREAHRYKLGFIDSDLLLLALVNVQEGSASLLLDRHKLNSAIIVSAVDSLRLRLKV